MNILKSLILLTISINVAHAAEITKLDCTLDAYPNEVLTFKMENLGQPEMNFVAEGEEYSPVFSTTSKNETITRLADTLNGQGGDLRVGTERILFFGDSAGIDFAYLALYKNSDYTRGFVRIDFNFGEEKQYSKLNCAKSIVKTP